jgi:hypothetical protein
MAIIRNFRLPFGIGISADYIETFGSIQSVNTSTGSVVARGGLGVSKDTHIGGFLHVLNSTNASSGATAALVVDGGIGVSRDIYIGGTVIAGGWAGNAITGRYGGTGYTTYTKGDLIVGAGGTFIKQTVGSDGSVLIANSTAGSGISWRTAQFGNFISTTTQQVLGANIATPITVNDLDSSEGISIMGGAGTSSRIQINDAGVYSIQFSAQLNLVTGSTPQVCSIWLKKNGTDIAGSTGLITVTGHNEYTVASWNNIETFTAGQYFEYYFSSPDLHMSIEALSGLTTPTRPDSPSMAITVIKVF